MKWYFQAYPRENLFLSRGKMNNRNQNFVFFDERFCLERKPKDAAYPSCVRTLLNVIVPEVFCMFTCQLIIINNQ